MEYALAQAVFVAGHVALKLLCLVEAKVDEMDAKSNSWEGGELNEIERDEEQAKIEQFRDRAEWV